MVSLFFVRNLKIEFLTIQSSQSVNLLIKSASLLFSRIILVISRFRFFTLQILKILTAFSCSLGLLLSGFYNLTGSEVISMTKQWIIIQKFWKRAQEVIHCFQFSPCGILTFFFSLLFQNMYRSRNCMHQDTLL